MTLSGSHALRVRPPHHNKLFVKMNGFLLQPPLRLGSRPAVTLFLVLLLYTTTPTASSSSFVVQRPSSQCCPCRRCLTDRHTNQQQPQRRHTTTARRHNRRNCVFRCNQHLHHDGGCSTTHDRRPSATPSPYHRRCRREFLQQTTARVAKAFFASATLSKIALFPPPEISEAAAATTTPFSDAPLAAADDDHSELGGANDEDNYRILRTTPRTPKQRRNNCQQRSKDGDSLEISFVGRIVGTDEVFFASGVGRGDDDTVLFVLGDASGVFPPVWNFGLRDMCVGDKRTLLVPPALADENGPQQNDRLESVLPPNSTLTYDVLLVSLNGLATQ